MNLGAVVEASRGALIRVDVRLESQRPVSDQLHYQCVCDFPPPCERDRVSKAEAEKGRDACRVSEKNQVVPSWSQSWSRASFPSIAEPPGAQGPYGLLQATPQA